MWILDCYSKKGRIFLWLKDKRIKRVYFKFPNYFYLYLPEQSIHTEMLSAIESLYKVEDCEIRTIYGSLKGFKIYAGRDVAEKIEIQAKDAKLFNVDLRPEQKWMADKGVFPCSNGGGRFDLDFELPLSIASVDIKGDFLDPKIEKAEFNGKELKGSENEIVKDLISLVEAEDPDLIIMSDADFWMHRIQSIAIKLGIKNTISRTGRFLKISQKFYWSYGRAKLRKSALLPEGRILIDSSAFNYRETGLNGIMIASRISAISPNLASRLSPGTLISLYEIYEALRKGIAVPFRKSDAERRKSLEELKSIDKGGMIFQPVPGLYEKVWQLDFTSMYPSIIVKYNLSPETLECNDKHGFLSEILKPLLELRIRAKRAKKDQKIEEGLRNRYTEIDFMLKWLLVTCFGYTGYRNAKFGRIEVHEEICRIGREILIRTKEIAEELGFEILHGIVDCLWLRGEAIEELRKRVENEIGLPFELEKYDWIVFLPMKDCSGAYNRYYGRLSSGEMKIRGVYARKGDTPEYVRRMQIECFKKLSEAKNCEEIAKIYPEVVAIFSKFLENLRYADPGELIVKRILGTYRHSKNTLEASAVREYRKLGIRTLPGTRLEFLVVDSRRRIVKLRDFQDFDRNYYLNFLERAWSEIEFLFRVNRLKKSLT
ncbi:MAG: type B DNA-directed DNA polymerase [Archaeoglobaceae archaeon]